MGKVKDLCIEFLERMTVSDAYDLYSLGYAIVIEDGCVTTILKEEDIYED